MPPLPDDPDHTKPSSCDGDYQNTWCPLPPILPPPSPYPPPPPPASHGRSTVIIALIIASSVLAFLALCLSVSILARRRRLWRRREALLEAALAAAGPAAFADDGGGGGPGEEVVHHVWHIRTVGLDEAAIESIALTQYRAGGALGASDCTVCLGEFRDGELLRLLPKCAHAFHVQCIDTWLRAHVNCPLCRADVMDPAAAAAGQPEQPPGAHAAEASAERSASNAGTMEQERPDQQANEQHELRVQIEQPDPSSSPERPHRHPGARRAQNFRRVASMDSPSPSTGSAEEEVPEDERADGEKQGTGGAACCECEVSPGLGQLHRAAMKRSLSASSRWTLLSRHCRTRSSLLPL